MRTLKLQERVPIRVGDAWASWSDSVVGCDLGRLRFLWPVSAAEPSGELGRVSPLAREDAASADPLSEPSEPGESVGTARTMSKLVGCWGGASVLRARRLGGIVGALGSACPNGAEICGSLTLTWAPAARRAGCKRYWAEHRSVASQQHPARAARNAHHRTARLRQDAQIRAVRVELPCERVSLDRAQCLRPASNASPKFPATGLTAGHPALSYR